MKIVDFETFVVGNPPPHYGGFNWVFLKLITDEAIEGIGEAYCVPFRPNAVVVINATAGTCLRTLGISGFEMGTERNGHVRQPSIRIGHQLFTGFYFLLFFA